MADAFSSSGLVALTVSIAEYSSHDAEGEPPR
jgi:hypothetical protein